MPTTRVTIKYVNEPKEGKTRGSIKGTEGDFFGCPQGMLRHFQAGKTYDVTYSESGEWKTVTGAAEVLAEVRRGAPASSEPAAPSTGGYYKPTCPQDAERMFVCATLGALIRAGEVKNDKRQLWNTTNMLRDLWQASFGEGAGTFTASEASRVARG